MGEIDLTAESEDGILVSGLSNGGSRVGCVGRSVVGGAIPVAFTKSPVASHDLGETRMHGEKHKLFHGEPH